MLVLCLSGALRAATTVTLTKLGTQSAGTASQLHLDTHELLGEIRAKTGLGFTGPVSLVLCTTHESFKGYLSSLPGGHFEALGIYANPEIADGQHVIALNLELISAVGARSRGVYKHELCHAVLLGCGLFGSKKGCVSG